MSVLPGFGDTLRCSLACREGSRSIGRLQLGCHLLLCAGKGAGWPDIFVCQIFVENKHLHK